MTLERQKKKDGVDEKFQLIYKPPNSGLLITATSFCTFGSFTCPTFLLQYTFDYYFGDNPELIQQISTFQLGLMGTAAAFSIIALYFCRSIPMRIYNHEKEYEPNLMKKTHLNCYTHCLFRFRYIAFLPGAIPGLTNRFAFEKGDIKDKKSTGDWGRNLLLKFIKPGFETASFYKIKDKPIFLTIKCFEKPIHFYEMFANTAKYARKIKQLDSSK